MTKQKSTPAVKTIEEAKAQSRRAKGKQRYVATESWLTMFRYWYSPSGKRYKATASAIAIYSFIAGLNEQGKECYANQDTLGKVGRVEARQARNIIRMFEDLGVVHVEDRKGQTSIYTAFPFTDAHITPPEALTEQLPVAVSDEVPAPEPVKAAEEQSIPDWDDIPCAWDDFDYQSAPTMPIQQDSPEFPWGGVAICKPNGQPPDAAVKWALTETMGDENAAYQLISRVVSERTGRTEVFTPQTEEDFDSIPF
ncbi:TPA: hypothetical protein NRM82_004414 [Klebsiella pneumoniae]|nr:MULTISPECIES: hypothetical protein [Enterobacteriaceae]HEP0314112.1 hypothetical protein [Enterobacter bugandensis]AZP88649.1 hypothetical protein D1637_25660 [Klebsiella pneumoniae]EFH9692078.1 hypothetical protein [Escherichia coli]EFK5477015.1 hypothetical protein [Escherichia coli]EHN8836647.1 hypothetical protein [Enterobacter hormaechei]